jgi:hypothetical protein
LEPYQQAKYELNTILHFNIKDYIIYRLSNFINTV